MGPLQLLAKIAALATLWAMAFAAPAAASTPGELVVPPSCHAASGLDENFSDMIDRKAWNCSQTGWQANRPAAWLRFESASWPAEQPPRTLVSRIARHQQITIAALDADGTLRTRSFAEADAQPIAAGPVFRLPLPEVTAHTQALLIRIERPHSVPLLTEARLVVAPETGGWSEREMMMLALVVGMLVLPLLFDIFFFAVLRERIFVIHAAMVCAMMTYVLCAGGLISVFVTLPVAVIAIFAPLSWAIACGLSAVFLAHFVERRAQSPLMRKITLATGVWTIIVPGFFALQMHVTQSIDDMGYFLAFIPLIFVIIAALTDAIIRGSRAARFLAFAWVPVILASIERMMRGLGVYVGPSSLDQALYVATGIEVMVISLAIADRFMAMQRERDAALTEARMLEQLSTRDPLTGLMNRRALETRFDELLTKGFETFALVDLDRFKAVNDVHGHQIGDAALIACASAIRGGDDRDSIAVRLGGEEFVVLLRGERTIERAEALRQAIPIRIASDLPGLDLPITASMGVIAVPDAVRHNLNFCEFYARADALMYEAKASGRNRMAYERVTIFSKAPPSRGARRARERDVA